MAEENKLTVKGASGTTYDFWTYLWGQQFKAVGGEYLVLKRQAVNGNYGLLYIGQTSDLFERFDNHHKKPCFDRNGKTHIAIGVETSEQNRLNIEADLVQNYQTSCNG